jgi:ferredoxin
VWLLTAAMLLPSLTVLPAAAAGAVTTLDFSNPSSPVTVEVGAADFVSLLVGQQISSAERTYLNASFSGEALLYSDAIDSDCVKTAFEGTTLTVLARSYSYMAPSGAQISWVPTTASLNGKMRGLEYSFASSAYETEYADVDASAKHQLIVDYTCTMTIPAAVSDYYINHAYDYAFELWEKSYRYREYQSQLSAHEAYLAAKAAYRTGAGLVEILTHRANLVTLQTLIPEAIVSVYDENYDRNNILASVKRADTILIGCGLGQTAPNPVLATLRFYRDEYLEHVNDKSCRAAQCNALSDIVLDQAKCVKCKLCLRSCPVEAISADFVIDPDKCTRCNSCVDICPKHAIRRIAKGENR